MQRLVFALFLFVLSFYAQSAEDPWLHLEKASQAARKLSYKGIFLYQNHQDVRSIEITHLNNGSEEFARIVTLDGKPREALSRGNNMVVFNPNKENVMIQKKTKSKSFPCYFALRY